MPNGDIWILGATGRVGRAVADRLAARGLALVLVGRNVARLEAMKAGLGNKVAVKTAATLPSIAALIANEHPHIVINTIGPFTQTALPIARACPPSTHYVDISNELPSVQSILSLHDHAAAAESVFVTGAGFGVLATESVVLRLCEGQPPATRVRCAAIPAVEAEPGPLGEALAASIAEGFAMGGRRYEDGRLVPTALLSDFERVPLPDGRLVGTAGAPSGELEAAYRASGAPRVVSTTSMVPSAPILRALLSSLMAIMRIAFVRRFAMRRIAAIEVKQPAVRTAQVSWSHAKVEWPSGDTRQGWLRTGDAMTFSAEVMSQVVLHLANGDREPGAYTPGALFGSGLAELCGGEFVDSDMLAMR